MENKFRSLYDKDLTDSITELVNQSSIYKSHIFNCFINKYKVDALITKKYISFIDDFLNFWESYGLDMKDKLANTTATKSSHNSSIKYSEIKDLIYGSNDYASIIKFHDGVINGIEDGKFENKSDDIDDFFRFTVSKAFNDRADSVAGLLENSLSSSFGFSTDDLDSAEIHYFNSVKNYKGLFNVRDKIELFKAIYKIVDFMSSNVNKNDNPYKAKKINISIAAISNIIEYITFSATAYATRIYVLGLYFYPFINSSGANANKESFSESVEESSDTKYSSLAVDVMNRLDESECKKTGNISKLLDSMAEFIKMIGATAILGDNAYRMNSTNYRYCPFTVTGNVFFKSLINNDIICILKEPYKYNPSLYDVDAEAAIREINNLLKYSIHNNLQSVQGTSTAKHELFNAIKDVKCGDTIKEQRELAVELFKFAWYVTSNLHNMITHNIGLQTSIISNSKDGNPNVINNLGVRNMVAENIRVLTDFYSEVVLVFIEKAREIERSYNRLNKVNEDRILDKMKLNIEDDSNIANAVPDTFRVSPELNAMYALPTFESIEMYEEYLSTIPAFANDPYMEAVDIRSLINQIFAFLNGLLRRMSNFFQNQKLKKAFQWVKDYKNDILARDYSNVQLNIVNFKLGNQNSNTEHVGWDMGSDAVTKKLFNIEAVVDLFNKNSTIDENAVNTFIANMYPNDVVYKWYQDESKNNNKNYGNTMVRNSILYYSMNNVAVDVPKNITVSGDQLRDRIEDWVETIAANDDAYDLIKKTDKLSKDWMNNIKKHIDERKSANKTNQTTTNTNTNSNNVNGNNNTTDNNSNNNANNNANTSATNSNNNNSGENDALNKLLLGVNQAIERIYGTYTTCIMTYLVTIYKQLTSAYKLAGGNNGNVNNQNNQNNQPAQA